MYSCNTLPSHLTKQSIFTKLEFHKREHHKCYKDMLEFEQKANFFIMKEMDKYSALISCVDYHNNEISKLLDQK